MSFDKDALKAALQTAFENVSAEKTAADAAQDVADAIHDYIAPPIIASSFYTLAADQSAGIAAGSPIRFATENFNEASGVAFNGGTYTWTLTAGNIYRLAGSVFAGGSGAFYFVWQFYNVTNSSWFNVSATLANGVGRDSNSRTASAADHFLSDATTLGFIRPSSSVDVQARIVALSGAPPVTAIYRGMSGVEIQQMR